MMTVQNVSANLKLMMRCWPDDLDDNLSVNFGRWGLG